MRKIVLALAVGASFVGTAANARDGALYLGLEGGASVSPGTNLDIGTTSDAATLDTDAGWDAGIALGYDFGSFRLEAEGSLKDNNQQKLVANGNFDVDPVSAGNQPLASVIGGSQTQSLMVNAMFDLGGEDGIAVSAGGGVGFAKTEIDTKIDGVVTPLLNDEATGFAWQILAGARLPISDTLELGVKYRLFNASGIDLTSATSGPVSASFTSHSVLATLTLNLGG